MLQKIKKSHLIDFFFFLFLFLCLWGIWRFRSLLASKFVSKLTGTEFRINHIASYGLFKLNLYGIQSNFLSIDTLSISTSLLEVIRFRLKTFALHNVKVYVDSFPFSYQEKGVKKKFKKKKRFSIPELPFFLARLYLKNCSIYYNSDSLYIGKLQVDFKGTTQNFFARITMEEGYVNKFHLEFTKANIYKTGNTLKILNGEFCSNVFCIENMSAEYDSMLSATISGVSFKKMNILVNNLHLTVSPLFDSGKINLSDIEIHDRILQEGTITFKQKNKDIRFKLEIMSDWLTSIGKGKLVYSGPLSYSLDLTHFTYEEKDAFIKGKLFLNGIRDRLKGILRVNRCIFKEKELGEMEAFFELKNPPLFVLDSAFISHNNSLVSISGIITPDSQFIYLSSDVKVEDFDIALKGHITGNLSATTMIKKGQIFLNAHFKMKGLKTPYGTAKYAQINIHSISEDSVSFNIHGENILPLKGPLLNTLNVYGIVSNLTIVNYVVSMKSNDESIYLTGSAYKGEKEYTIDIDTLYGILDSRHLYSERALFLSYRRGTFSLTTGNLYLENGRLRLQGSFNKANGLNLMLQADSIQLPFQRTQDIIISTRTQITGTLDNPIFVSQGEVHNPNILGMSAKTITYSVSFVNQNLSLDYIKVLYGSGLMTAKGNIIFPKKLLPLTYDSIIPDISIEFEKFDITPLFSFISEVYSIEEAQIEGYINIKGTMKNPFFSGNLLLTGQNGYLSAVGIRTYNIKSYMQFAGNKIVLKSLRGECGTGEILAFGTINTKDKLFDSPNITISAQNVSLEIGSEIQTICDAHLFLTNGKKTPLLLEGNVQVKEGYLYAEFSAPRSAKREESNPVLSLKLAISWNENVYLINEIAEIEFSGNITYTYNESGMLINGGLFVLGGSFSYFDRLFKVDEGKVEFNNLYKIDPSLNISAVTDVDSYTIRLNISGTLSEPLINLTSEPPLDEGNILALLTFGKLLSEEGANTFSSTLLERKALGLAQSYILRNIKRKLGLRELEVSTGSFEDDPHLTIGFYVTRDIYLKYYHDFLSVQYDRFDLRYRISRYFGLNSVRDEDGRYYFGVFFEKRF